MQFVVLFVVALFLSVLSGALFALPIIVWEQAWGLLILCALLFKDIGVQNSSSNN